MRDMMELALVDVQSVTVRAVPGEGQQAELQVKTKRGSLTLRLIVQPGRQLRVTDMRQRDRRRQSRVPVPVHFDALK